MNGKVMVDTENALVTRSFNSFYHTVNTNYMIRKSFQSRARSWGKDSLKLMYTSTLFYEWNFKTASDTKKFTPLTYD